MRKGTRYSKAMKLSFSETIAECGHNVEREEKERTMYLPSKIVSKEFRVREGRISQSKKRHKIYEATTSTSFGFSAPCIVDKASSFFPAACMVDKKAL